MSHFSCLVVHNEDDDLDEILEPWMENCCGTPSFEYMEFFEDEGCDVDDATGRRGYWQNPNARWDWFVVGGRFEHAMPLKDGGTATEARVSEVDFRPMKSKHAEKVREWAHIAGDAPTDSLEKRLSYLMASDLRRKYADAEDYASAYDHFVPDAVVVDGEWHEQGRMGWWGIRAEAEDAESRWRSSFYDRFIKGLDPDKLVTIVDCHI